MMRGFMMFVVLVLGGIACATPLTDSPPVYVCPTSPPATYAPATLPPAGTPIAIPTLAPPTLIPTPYIITPPQDFYVGDAIFVGNPGAAQRVRFRLMNVRTLPPNIHAWELEVRNLGTEVYTITPTLVMTLTAIRLPDLTIETGEWIATEGAAVAAGIPISTEIFDMQPNETLVFHFAAYTSEIGSIPHQWTLELDLGGESGNRITWINQVNPYCSGDIAD